MNEKYQVLLEAMRFANAWNDGIAEVSTIELERLLNDLEDANHRAEMLSLQLDVATNRGGNNFKRAIAAEVKFAELKGEQVPVAVGTTEECSPDVYAKGVSACLVDIPKEKAEVICRGISAASGVAVDWHYVGGRVHIKAMRVIAPQKPVVPEGLHPQTAKLVIEFATALAEKLHKAEQKYGFSDTWIQPDWKDKCLADFNHHIRKGDPRDVAAYCAFMWYHGWDTAIDSGWLHREGW